MKLKQAFISMLALGAITSTMMQSALAMDMTQAPNKAALTMDEESGALGGWSEETGYFHNVNAYNEAMSNALSRATFSSPIHTGERERSDFDGNTHYRAHGWTTWVGKRHYTRARLEVGGNVLMHWSVPMDSMRVWGTNGTEAVSPWWPWEPGIGEQAKTYYGS